MPEFLVFLNCESFRNRKDLSWVHLEKMECFGLKKTVVPVLIIGGMLIVLFTGYQSLKPLLAKKTTDVLVLEELPFSIEPKNPIPEVRHWDLAGRTYYYFNWGLKPTGGYSLELANVQNNLITLKAVTPQKDQMLIQVLTFPSLFISLPKGRYRYRVLDNEGRLVKDIFRPKNPPLKMTIFLPKEDGIARREILRDPQFKNTRKTKAMIALQALFNQDEMAGFWDQEVLPEGAVFSASEQKWYILLSRTFEHLGNEEKSLLSTAITRTVQALNAGESQAVEIVTDPAKLPE